jgi:glycosyltransferase involved in cell wall biosynthesis
MKIVIFGEPLRVPTSANPGRGMLAELISRRPGDKFQFVFFSDPASSIVLNDFFVKLKAYDNWEVTISQSNKWINYLRSFIGLDFYDLKVQADIFLNPDCTSLGKKGHPLIVTVADFSVFKGRKFASFKNPISYWIRKKIVAKGIKSGDKIAAISQNTLNELKALLPGHHNKATIIYNGIDPAWFKSDFDGSHTNSKYWIWWGQISNRKNLENVLNAYALLFKESTNKVPDFKIIYSNQNIPEHIVSLVQNLNISDKVIFERSKNLPDLVSDVAQSRGLIFASKVEGFGVPIIEAMATGIPVLTSNCSSMPEVAGNSAIFCDPFSIYSIKESMENLAKDFNFEEANIRSRKNWALNFTYSRAAEGYDNLITELFNE